MLAWGSAVKSSTRVGAWVGNGPASSCPLLFCPCLSHPGYPLTSAGQSGTLLVR